MVASPPAARRRRGEKRFAWKPKRLGDGTWIWLKSYWVRATRADDDRPLTPGGGDSPQS